MNYFCSIFLILFSSILFAKISYETGTKVGAEDASKRKNIVKEILIALLASVSLGLGSFFLLLWTGVYV